MPKPKKSTRPSSPEGGLSAFVFSDTHFGVHDPQALGVCMAIMEALQPQRIIHLGDLLDAYHISRFAHDPNKTERLQVEIDEAHAFLAALASMHPKAERWLLEGNHEDRLRRTAWEMLGPGRELVSLRSFQDHISWPKLLGLNDIGWNWVPTGQQTRTQVLPGIITKHGSVVRKYSGYTARAEWERYGKSGMSGHTHRMSSFYHRDHNGSHVWMETGCTCLLNPDYVQDPDWQQGCVVLTFDADGSRFNAEPIYIQDGRAIWRGKEYRA